LFLLITLLTVGAAAQDNVLTSEQTQTIERAREIALVYTANLPNFISTESIRRSVVPKGSQTWKSEDTLTFDVAFSVLDHQPQHVVRHVALVPIICAQYFRIWRGPICAFE
jgi:hypothetical protein